MPRVIRFDGSVSRHWSGKQPWRKHNYRDMMRTKTAHEYYDFELNILPWSEMLKPWRDPREFTGWEWDAPTDRPGWAGSDIWWQGGADYPEPYYGGVPCKELACNPAALRCTGGCSFIACICNQGPLQGFVIEDPTGGHVYIGGGAGPGFANTVQVCIDDDFEGQAGEFPIAVIGVSDGVSTYAVNVPLIGCIEQCCPTVTLTGADTVNTGNTWTGTISPACPGIECSVTSNSGCFFNCEVNEAGSQVTVDVGASDCGSFTVTISDECFDTGTDSKSVRIADNGVWRLCGSLGAGTFCSGPWCSMVDVIQGIYKYTIFCWGGGICITGQRTLTCDDSGFSLTVNPSVTHCYNGWSDCTSNWIAFSAAVWVWECSAGC